ncbi:hypothetical protein GCM10012275_36560 [Longimycelium tulufanense]|uniref:DUF4878 domain-containing protein n=1 Tax=Longimycelium tulufanense TaxID=907463 RepID=A0A8J3FWT1_9PSEU|nr:hypothetical protein [Longimycelium tulufanense]GGM62529.1 hypothetical protein GCM10012275_36560 [Longimycelium tulufanense]
MTYPPQQPGPYGQQPGGWPQQPGPQPGGSDRGQQGQPGFGQTGPQPQQGGWGQPPQGGWEQAPQGGQYGQPNPYQTGQFGQPGPYGQQPPGGYDPSQQFGGYPGYPGGAVPPKKKSPLPWILGGVGVLVIGAIVLVIALFGASGGGGSDPRQVAEAFVSSVNNKKPMDDGMVCDSYKARVKQMTEGSKNLPDGISPEDKKRFEDSMKNMSMKASLGSVTTSGDTAKAEVNTELDMGMGKPFQTKLTLDIKKESGDWKLCGFGGMGI